MSSEQDQGENKLFDSRFTLNLRKYMNEVNSDMDKVEASKK